MKHLFLGLFSVVTVIGASKTESDWEHALAGNTPETYAQYLRNHPGSPHEKDARARLRELELNALPVFEGLLTVSMGFGGVDSTGVASSSRYFKSLKVGDKEYELITSDATQYDKTLDPGDGSIHWKSGKVYRVRGTIAQTPPPGEHLVGFTYINARTIELLANTNSTNTTAGKPAAAMGAGDTSLVRVGAFSVGIPTKWMAFPSDDLRSLRRQYLDQSKQIYQQFSGQPDEPANSLDVAAYHIIGLEDSFVMVSFTVPPQADLISMLKNQVAEKMEWGVRQGYIHKYLGMVPVDNEQLSGFYVKTIGKSGNVEVSGGLEHRQRKNTVIQLTLLTPKSWDEAKATNTLTAILKSVNLKDK